ncbi:hypothetical protein AB3329_11620, partial [Streptococcus sp. H31]|uniref:hypothetical protein n=1 Tax=Streptococcus huangxiaojuni TaxID=3237239 RepID=UPI0034A4DB51
GTREILLYDNYYGYAKYKITLSATKDGNISISYNQEGVDGLKTSSNAVSSKGRYTSSQSVPVKGSALDKGLFNGSYQYAFDQNGVSGLSAALSGGNSRSEFGVKYVNGTLAAYSQTQSSASAALSDKSKGELSVAYEQGQYIRNSNVDAVPVESFDWGKVGNVAGSAVDFVGDTINSIDWGAVGELAVGALAVTAITAVGFMLGGPGGAMAGASAALLILNTDDDKNNMNGGI